MDKNTESILTEYLVNNIPEDFDEFREILLGASLKQLKEWRDRVINSFWPPFSSKHVDCIDEELAKIIPESTEMGLILDLNQVIDLESELGKVIEVWRSDIFPRILLREMNLDKLLDWGGRVSSDSGEWMLIEGQAMEVLPENLAGAVKLDQPLKWEESEIFQDVKSQELIAARIAEMLSQISPEPENTEELIRLRKQYQNSSYYKSIHDQLVKILPESLLKVNDITRLIRQEAEVSQTSDVWKDDYEICIPIMIQAIKLFDGVLVSSLPSQPWFLKMAKGEIETPNFLRLTIFRKVRDLMNELG